MISICAWSTWVNAQQSEESEKVTDPCDIEIAPIDPQQLATDPEKTKARVIALMLQDMDRCIGVHRTRITSDQQGNAIGAAPGSGTTQNESPNDSSNQTDPSKQAQTQAVHPSAEGATADADSTNTPNAEPVNTTLADILKDATSLPTSIQHNTNVFDLDSPDELVLDDYAKTLHEAYLAETDPVLKEALGKELTNYLNNQKR